MVQQEVPKAKSFSLQQFSDALAHARRKNSILVLTDPAMLPQEEWESLHDYVDEGGATLFLGPSPFAGRAQWKEGELLSDRDHLEAAAREAKAVEGFSSVQSWRHKNESGKLRGAIRTANTTGIPWDGVEVVASGFREWDAMVISEVPDSVRNGEANTLVFYAKGDARTSRLVLVCQEEDGSHWSRVLHVTSTWKKFIIRQETLSYFYGGSNRGGAGDTFSLARVGQVTVGLSMHLAPQPQGDHVFNLSNVHLCRDPRAGEDIVRWPDVSMLSPPYRRYETSASSVQVIGQSARMPVGELLIQSPLPQAKGLGGKRGHSKRWVPLAKAFDSRGEIIGWPAGIHVDIAPKGTVRRWGWIGTSPSGDSSAACYEMLKTALQRMHNGTFLFSAGAHAFTFAIGESIDVTARWYEGDQMRVPLRLAAEFLAHDGHVLRRVVSSVAMGQAGAVRGPVTLSLAKAPSVRGKAEPYTIRILLEDASGNGDVYDQLLQKVLVVPVHDYPGADEWVTVEQSHFQYQLTPYFVMGVNYRPQTVNGKAVAEQADDWLHPASFDPDLVERDLDVLLKLRANAIAISYDHARQAPQLRYVIEAARKRKIHLLLHVAGLSPLDFDPLMARRLLEAADLRDEPQVLAFDLAWEPAFGRQQQRQQLDESWRSWLVEQYGGVDQAMTDLEGRLWMENGVVVGPPDMALVTDGDHRSVVAVYRRFLDDYVSRRYGQIRRFLSTLGYRQLLTARTGLQGVGNPYVNAECPVDLASGAVHLDFLSPTGWNLIGSQEKFYEASFLTAYARGVAGGKPVVWTQFGTDVGRRPSETDLLNQASVFGNVFDMVSRSSAAGCFAWWYPGGYHVEQGYDMGLVGADGQLRPAGRALRTYANNLRSVRPSIPVWKGREVDRDRDARGLSALWDRWKTTYRKEAASDRIEEVRPVGFGKLTTDMPLLSVDGSPITRREPLLCANGEWGEVRAGETNLVRQLDVPLEVPLGHRIDFQLINTGPATWGASRDGKFRTVWVLARHESKKTEKLKVGVVPFGRTVSCSWQPTDEGRWELRPWLSRVGPFGEALEVVVVAPGRIMPIGPASP